MEHVRERSQELDGRKSLVVRNIRNSLITIARYVLPLVLFFVIWQVVSSLELISKLFFPAPSRILETLQKVIQDGTLVEHLRYSMMRMLGGFFIGGAIGLLLGLSMGWLPWLRNLADPLVAAFHPVPKSSLFPLVLIIFGLGETSKIVMVSIGAFFPMLINSMAGVRQIDPIYFDVAANYGASRGQIFRRVVLPGSLPSILSGVRLSMNSAIHITIVVEMILGKLGLGAMIWLSWETLRTTYLYAALITISVIGLLLNRTLEFVARRLVPWNDAQSVRS
ncbi:MAG: ABC transporter permease [Anaerolineae bacterium]|nr:MAG: ABC transporter permease [Anaerolineae bacterium]